MIALGKEQIILWLVILFSCLCSGREHQRVNRDIFRKYDPYEPSRVLVKKFWGIQDVTTSVGKLFRFKIPSDAFRGVVTKYEVNDAVKDGLPSWLIFRPEQKLLEGVPSVEDIGDTILNLKAYDPRNNYISLNFTIEVFPLFEKNTNNKKKCKKGQDVMMLSIVIDRNLTDIPTERRVQAVKDFSRYIGISYSTLFLLPQQYNVDLLSESLLIAGHGNTEHMFSNSKSSSVLTWQVGCNEKIWPEKLRLVDQIKRDARDGTLSEVLQLPVTEWNIISSTNPFRDRRHTMEKTASANTTEEVTEDTLDADEEYKDGDDENDEDDDEKDDTEPSAPSLKSSILKSSPALKETSTKTRTESFDGNKDDEEGEGDGDIDEHIPIRGSAVRKSSYPSTRTEEDPDEGGFTENPDIIVESSSATTNTSTAASSTTSSSTTVVATTSTTTSTSTSTPLTTQATTTVTVIPIREERKPPSVKRKLPVLTIVAGKTMRYKIPEDTFADEDGTVGNLTLSLVRPPGYNTSWIQLKPESRELFIAAAESDISKWDDFKIQAKDSDNMTQTANLTVVVQHPKDINTAKFEISLHLKFNNESYSNADTCASVENCYDGRIEWILKFLDALSSIYGDSDTSKISVTSISYDPFVISWMNDTLPLDQCDKSLVGWLVNTLTNDSWSNEVKQSVKDAIGPDVTVQEITWKGYGDCESVQKPHPPRPPLFNFSPSLRNHIPPLNLTVGELFLYKIPVDTFYDEGRNTRSLNLSLWAIERQPIPEDNWVQFDSVNQEICALPLATNYTNTVYQLVAQDQGNLEAVEVVVFTIYNSPPRLHNAEFSMQIDADYEEFVRSVQKQRRFIEKVATLYNNDTSLIVIDKFSPGSVFISWYNKTLPSAECSESAVLDLRKVLLTDDGEITEHVNEIMMPEFPVLSVSITPRMLCEGGSTKLHPIRERSRTLTQEIFAVLTEKEYFSAYVLPSLLIATMILLAGLIACVLYKRRSHGKMTVGDDERRSFRKKGVPVIFQDELEERLETRNNTPIIMKEEKPPLPPPEYHKSPPMATTALLSDYEDSGSHRSHQNGDRARKHTPIYRRPPPYA